MEKQKEAASKGQVDTKDPMFLSTVKYYNARDIAALRGDRTTSSFVEHCIVFLPLMWMHAIFVDHTKSFVVCLLYCFFRALYPFAFTGSYIPGMPAISITP